MSIVKNLSSNFFTGFNMSKTEESDSVKENLMNPLKMQNLHRIQDSIYKTESSDIPNTLDNFNMIKVNRQNKILSILSEIHNPQNEGDNNNSFSNDTIKDSILDEEPLISEKNGMENGSFVKAIKGKKLDYMDSLKKEQSSRPISSNNQEENRVLQKDKTNKTKNTNKMNPVINLSNLSISSATHNRQPTTEGTKNSLKHEKLSRFLYDKNNPKGQNKESDKDGKFIENENKIERNDKDTNSFDDQLSNINHSSEEQSIDLNEKYQREIDCSFSHSKNGFTQKNQKENILGESILKENLKLKLDEFDKVNYQSLKNVEYQNSKMRNNIREKNFSYKKGDKDNPSENLKQFKILQMKEKIKKELLNMKAKSYSVNKNNYKKDKYFSQNIQDKNYKIIQNLLLKRNDSNIFPITYCNRGNNFSEIASHKSFSLLRLRSNKSHIKSKTRNHSRSVWYFYSRNSRNPIQFIKSTNEEERDSFIPDSILSPSLNKCQKKQNIAQNFVRIKINDKDLILYKNSPSFQYNQKILGIPFNSKLNNLTTKNQINKNPKESLSLIKNDVLKSIQNMYIHSKKTINFEKYLELLKKMGILRKKIIGNMEKNYNLSTRLFHSLKTDKANEILIENLLLVLEIILIREADQEEKLKFSYNESHNEIILIKSKDLNLNINESSPKNIGKLGDLNNICSRLSNFSFDDKGKISINEKTILNLKQLYFTFYLEFLFQNILLISYKSLFQRYDQCNFLDTFLNTNTDKITNDIIPEGPIMQFKIQEENASNINYSESILNSHTRGKLGCLSNLKIRNSPDSSKCEFLSPSSNNKYNININSLKAKRLRVSSSTSLMNYTEFPQSNTNRKSQMSLKVIYPFSNGKKPIESKEIKFSKSRLEKKGQRKKSSGLTCFIPNEITSNLSMKPLWNMNSRNRQKMYASIQINKNIISLNLRNLYSRNNMCSRKRNLTLNNNNNNPTTMRTTVKKTELFQIEEKEDELYSELLDSHYQIENN